MASVTELLELLTHRHGNKRAAAAEALGALGERVHPEALDALVAACSDKQEKVRLAAMVSLSRLDSGRATAAAEGGLTDSKSNVRAAAAELLGALSAPGACPRLREMLSDKQPPVRRAAARALAAIGGAEARTILARTLMDPALGEKTARTLAGALASLGATDALLDGLRHGPHKKVRAEAATALAGADDPRVYPALVEATRDRYPWVRWYAVQALGKHGDDRAVPMLVRILHGSVSGRIDFSMLGKAQDALAALGAFDELAALAEDPGAWQRGAGLVGLSKTGDPRAYALVVRGLDDDAVAVQIKALRGLMILADMRCLPLLLPILDQGPNRSESVTSPRVAFWVLQELIERHGEEARAAILAAVPGAGAQAAEALRGVLAGEKTGALR